MKRILSAVLVVAMMVSILSGCAGSAPTASSTPPASGSGSTSSVSTSEEPLTGTLKIWTHQNPAWNEAHQKKIDEFVAANPGVTIEMENFPYMEFQSKLQTSLISGGGADIYEIFGGWANDYMSTGALSKVPDGLAATMKNDYYPSATGGFTYNDAYYGIPLEFNIEYGGMLVNKKLFDEKKLAYPTTWAELEDIADATSERNGEIMEMRGFEFATGDGVPYTFLAMILSNGGQYLSADGNSVDFSTPQAVDAMTKLVGYVKDRNWTNLDGLGLSGEGGFSAVYKDNAMMALVGPWGVSYGTSSFGLTYGTDFEYIQLPPVGPKMAYAAETGWGLTVPEKSKQKELAWKYIEWFSQPENLVEHNIACSQIPPSKTTANNPKYLEAVPYAKPILNILEDGQYIGNFNTSLVKQNLYGVYSELVTSNKYASIADGLKDAQEKINTLAVNK